MKTKHQPHNVGRNKLTSGLCTILMMLMLSYCANSTFYNAQINVDDIMDFFDANGCVSGHLTMAPTAPISMPQMQDNHVTSSGGETEDGGGSETVTSTNEANAAIGKEKTPMCLVNELARYNKIVHQYRLTNEEGPPHKKKFTVTLEFGNEEYTAEGASIKKAQHAAASVALKKTMYKHPPPKCTRSQRGSKGNITPTVELNALAMKRGEPTNYTVVESPQYQYNGFVNYHSHRGMYTQAYNEHFGFTYGRGERPPSYRGAYNPRVDQRYYGNKPPLYKVVVKVGEREFCGEGISAQAARHDAASKALMLLLTLPVENCPSRAPCDGNSAVGVDADSSTELKSPISLVHEIALKRSYHVSFEVVSEKGQPHMRTFVTRCTVGDYQTLGEGNGKKISKKRSAEKMLELLRSLPPVNTPPPPAPTSSSRMKRKSNPSKKKSRNLIKDTNAQQTPPPPVKEPKYETENLEDMNPISRLIQIQQAKKDKEPVYILKEERGIPRRREFFMEVRMGEHSYVGSGSNKKLAKRNAAEGLLQQLGYSSSTVTRTGHPIPQQHTPKQVRFSDEKSDTPSRGSNAGGVSGRQLVPGLLLMKDTKASTNSQHMPHKGVNLKTTATIAKEYLSSGNSPTADALAGHKRAKSTSVVRPTEQLLYLAQILNFHVQFSDFPKGNHSEFLSLVSLATDPPQVCHGAGTTKEHSHDQASLNALRALSEMGLDSITPAKKEHQTTTIPASAQTDGNTLYLSLANTIPKEDNYINGK